MASLFPKSIAANASFIDYFETVKSKNCVALNTEYVAAWNGIQAGMIAIGLVTAGFISDRFGRKIYMLLICLAFALSIILGLTAKYWYFFLIAWAFNGVAAGFFQATLMCYVVEFAPLGLRGDLLTGYSFFIALGQLAGNIGLYIIEQNNINWRAALYSELVFLGIFLPFAIFAPESAWFYANKFDHDNAKKVLRKINDKVDGYDIDHEYAVVAATVEHNSKIVQQSAAVS